MWNYYDCFFERLKICREEFSHCRKGLREVEDAERADCHTDIPEIQLLHEAGKRHKQNRDLQISQRTGESLVERKEMVAFFFLVLSVGFNLVLLPIVASDGVGVFLFKFGKLSGADIGGRVNIEHIELAFINRLLDTLRLIVSPTVGRLILCENALTCVGTGVK